MDLNCGIIILESEDPCASLLRLSTKDYNSYIGFYRRINDIVMVKIHETMTGRPPCLFAQNINFESILELSFIKRIELYESMVESYVFTDAIESTVLPDNVTLEKTYSKILLSEEISINGYTIVNSIINNIMNTNFMESYKIIDNNVLQSPQKIVNDNFTVNIQSSINTSVHIQSLISAFKNLYVSNDDYRKTIHKKQEIGYKIKKPSLTDSLNELRYDIKDIANNMYDDKIAVINLSKIIHDYNNLIEAVGFGTKISDDTLPSSHGAIITTQGCLNVNNETMLNSCVKILKAGEGTITINSKVDGDIVVPLFNADLSDFSTEDLHNINEMVNSLNISDPRFYSLQNNITDILTLRYQK